MHKFITLIACSLLGACASQPTSSPSIASAPTASAALAVVHDTQAIPIPVDAGLLAQTPQSNSSEAQPRLGTPAANYRVFALELSKGESYSLSVKSLCNQPCAGFNKLALKPQALLLDSHGVVIAKQPSSASTVLGQTTLSWDGKAVESGTYYLLVPADNGNTERTWVIEDSWLNNSPLMSVNTGIRGFPFSKINPNTQPR